MTLAPGKRVRSITIGVAVLALILAISVLAIDYALALSRAGMLAERLDAAQLAAQTDPDASGPLQTEVERQTDASLARKRLQSVAGVVALVATGLGLTLVKLRPAEKPLLPEPIATAVTRRSRASQPMPAVDEAVAPAPLPPDKRPRLTWRP